MMIVRTAVAVAAALTVCGSAAAAQWYGVGALGAAHAESDYHDLVSVHNNTYNTDTSNRDHPWSFTGKLGAGVQFNDYFGLEGAVYWIGPNRHDHAGTASNGQRVSSHAEFKSWGFGLDAVGYLPVTDAINLYGKAGVAVLFQTGESTAVEKEYEFKDHETHWAPKVAVGGEWFVTESVALRFEYERIFKAAKTTTTGNNTVVSADTDYNLITVGLRYNF